MADSAQSQRNFRSAYLGKVGIKGVEEKKSLEILLSEQSLDLKKLREFCLRFPVSATYRPFLWKLLLGIIPPQKQTCDYVMQQRKEQHDDLREALFAMRRVTDTAPLPEVHLQMFLVEEGRLPFEKNKMMQDSCNRIFMSMSQAMSEVTDDPVDIYWLTVRFYKHQDKFRDFFPIMVQSIEYYLKKEEPDNLLSVHLTKLRAFHVLPFTQWFKSCFVEVLPDTSFERIWDKIIGGSCKILVYVAVGILLTLRRPILSMNNVEDVLKYLSTIPQDSGDIIVGKAIEIWQKHGSLLMPGTSRGNSPNIGITEKGHNC